jgi:hypothetical protein
MPELTFSPFETTAERPDGATGPLGGLLVTEILEVAKHERCSVSFGQCSQFDVNCFPDLSPSPFID